MTLRPVQSCINVHTYINIDIDVDVDVDVDIDIDIDSFFVMLTDDASAFVRVCVRIYLRLGIMDAPSRCDLCAPQFGDVSASGLRSEAVIVSWWRWGRSEQSRQLLLQSADCNDGEPSMRRR